MSFIEVAFSGSLAHLLNRSLSSVSNPFPFTPFVRALTVKQHSYIVLFLSQAYYHNHLLCIDQLDNYRLLIGQWCDKWQSDYKYVCHKCTGKKPIFFEVWKRPFFFLDRKTLVLSASFGRITDFYNCSIQALKKQCKNNMILSALGTEKLSSTILHSGSELHKKASMPFYSIRVRHIVLWTQIGADVWKST